MIKCIQCLKEFKAKRITAKFCSDKCKLAYHRKEVSVSNSVKPVIVSDDISVSKDSVSYSILKDKKVYKRQAVNYKDDKYSSRPQPDNITDKPDKQNRCIYQRTDKTSYVIDATGISIDYQEDKLKDLTAQDLYDAIETYNQDEWKDSKEYKELLRRLKIMKYDDLITQGYRVPSKYNKKR